MTSMRTAGTVARAFSFLLLGFFAFSSSVFGSVLERPWIGTQKALVLLVEWSDRPTQVTKAQVEDVFFSTGTHSLKDFFDENSTQRFHFSGDVLEWRRSPQRWERRDGCELQSIVREAWNLFGRTIRVSDYDSDHDGKIDHLFVVHSGRIQHDRVTPRCAFTDFAQADYTTVFQSQGIGSIGTAIPIGFYLHEAGHAYFSFPDLYGDHYHGQYGIGMWGMMGLGAWGTSNQTPVAELFRYPAHFEPWSKVRMGWATTRVLRERTEHVVLRPVETTGEIVVIPGNSARHYLEFRSGAGFSRGNLGTGMLIWRDYALQQADGRDDLNHGNSQGRRPLPPISENFGDGSDPFPGTANVRVYEDTKDRIRIENITQFSDRIEFDFTPLSGYRPGSTEDLENGSPARSWEELAPAPRPAAVRREPHL